MQNNIALLLIDFQNGFENQANFGGNRNNPDAEAKAKKLLDFFRSRKLPVYHTRHNSASPESPLYPGQPGNDFIDLLAPLQEETVIEKEVNSAFIGTNLKGLLEEQGIDTLIIGGLITNHCVSTTVRMAGNFGYKVIIASDATATFDRKGINGEVYPAELVHQISLASLHNEFGQVLNSEEVLKVLKALTTPEALSS